MQQHVIFGMADNGCVYIVGLRRCVSSACTVALGTAVICQSG